MRAGAKLQYFIFVVTFEVSLFIMAMSIPFPGVVDHSRFAKTDAVQEDLQELIPLLEILRQGVVEVAGEIQFLTSFVMPSETEENSSATDQISSPWIARNYERKPQFEQKSWQLFSTYDRQNLPHDKTEFKPLSLPQTFEDWDLNGDGWLDMEEMANVSGTTILESKLPFTSADQDGDDLISRKEFRMAPWSLNGSSSSNGTKNDSSPGIVPEKHEQSRSYGVATGQSEERGDQSDHNATVHDDVYKVVFYAQQYPNLFSNEDNDNTGYDASEYYDEYF